MLHDDVAQCKLQALGINFAQTAAAGVRILCFNKRDTEHFICVGIFVCGGFALNTVCYIYAILCFKSSAKLKSQT